MHEALYDPQLRERFEKELLEPGMFSKLNGWSSGPGERLNERMTEVCYALAIAYDPEGKGLRYLGLLNNNIQDYRIVAKGNG